MISTTPAATAGLGFDSASSLNNISPCNSLAITSFYNASITAAAAAAYTAGGHAVGRNGLRSPEPAPAAPSTGTTVLQSGPAPPSYMTTAASGFSAYSAAPGLSVNQFGPAMFTGFNGSMLTQGVLGDMTTGVAGPGTYLSTFGAGIHGVVGGAGGSSAASLHQASAALSRTADLQPMISYRRPFTSAKPPYSYISLITMAIQVGLYD